MTMTDISCKNLFPKECRDINLVEAIIKHQILRQTRREATTVALLHHAKIRFTNVSSNFAFNKYKCFMVNKNTIRTFCGCNSFKKDI